MGSEHDAQTDAANESDQTVDAESSGRASASQSHTTFKAGEHGPSSSDGQHVIANVRQQTGGAMSMLPQDGVELDQTQNPTDVCLNLSPVLARKD